MMRLFHVIIVVIVYIISSFKKAGFRPRPFLHLLLSFSTSLCNLSILSDVFTRTFEHVSESDEEYSRASEKPNEIDAQRERKVPFNLPVTSYVRQTGQARRGYINYNIYVDLYNQLSSHRLALDRNTKRPEILSVVKVSKKIIVIDSIIAAFGFIFSFT